ncbi:MAG: YicC family protein [Planctomycetota bacterium]|nr:YicC family protein [Planctomycetota bacterium]
MTGYGEAAAELDRFVISIELRSVNNRFLKLISKVPDELSFLQNDLESQIRETLIRGTVYLTLRCEPRDTSDLYEIDPTVLKKYLATVKRLKAEIVETEDLSIRDLLLLPGVVRAEETMVPEKESMRPAIRPSMEDALSRIQAMRQQEGRHIDKDLRERLETLTGLIDSVRKEAPRAVEEYHKKLDQRLRLLLGEHQGALAPEDILKEVAILAERSDINEEIGRMESHIAQFSEVLDGDGPVGRKLEFIVQEMFREANTMGSKSASSGLTRDIVQLKAEVDRMKEQVVNVE